MSHQTALVESCCCGAQIKISEVAERQYYSNVDEHLARFHKQHEACVQKPIKHVLSLQSMGQEP